MLDKIIDGAFKAGMTIVLSGIVTAIVIVTIKWMIDLGFLWSCVVIGIGYLLYRLAKSGKSA